MQAAQITTFAVNGKPVQERTALAVTWEKDEPQHLESGVINLYPELTYQEIEGFGGAVTDSVGYLYAGMTQENRRRLLQEYFGPDGMHYRFVRMHIDSCDYSLDEYQAVADPLADPEFATFTLKRDQQYMLPMLRDILAISAEPVSVLLSPWSPPKQWKTPPERPSNDAVVYGGSVAGVKPVDYEQPSRCNGGRLKPEHYGDWARYLVRYIQAYLAEGVPVTMLTLQNESIAATMWDSCVWSAQQQKAFLRDHLYPAFQAAGLLGKVGLYIWDHNKERVYEFSREVLDETTEKMVEGIAFHWYSGDHFEAVGMTHDCFPQLKLMSSECCALHPPGQGGRFCAPAVGVLSAAEVELEDAQAYAHDIIGGLNHGMNRWIDWNLCVDAAGGPRHVPYGFSAPVGDDEHGGYRETMTLAVIGHFSRFIRPGARRIGLSRGDDRVELTAAQNPDGSIAVVALNRGHKDAGYAIRMQGKVVRFVIPAGTISTILL